MTRHALLALPLLLAAACANPLTVEGPSTTAFGAAGLEHVLELDPNHPWAGSRGGFALSSRIVNNGEAPVTLRVRTCYLRYGTDVTASPSIQLLAQALPSCIPESDVITLQPRESSRPLWFGGVVQDPGRYIVSVRHVQDGDFWGRIVIIAK